MKHTLKTFLLAFVAMMVPIVGWGQTNGSCGANLTWNLTDGELVIEGTGAMYNYADKSAQPWAASRDAIERITVKEGVTTLGEKCFNHCYNCSEVSLPNSLTEIGTDAFFECSRITSITIPASVTSIGHRVFRDCGSLTAVTFNEGIENIGVEAFRACGQLTTINLPQSLTTLNNSAFFECQGLTSMVIPEGMTCLDFNTFAFCSNLQSVELPSTLESIKSGAFYNCEKLSSIVCKATTPPALENEACFSSVSKAIPVYVPAESLPAYKAAPYWNTFTCFVVIGSPAVPEWNEEGYYEISNANQLFWFAAYVNADNNNRATNAVLTADIDLENRLWTPIGYFNEAVNPYVDNNYCGVFDGNNHVIKNLNVHVSDGSEAGLFSRITNGTLKNLGVINATVQSDHIIGGNSYRAGVLAGEINDAFITNVFSSGALSIVTDHQEKGGIAGECNNSILTNCYTTYGALTATNVRVATNCFYLADEANASSAGTAVTAAQMASGEVAYKLGNAYGQTIGTDALPVLGGPHVYYGYTSCKAAEKIYTNDASVTADKHHNYVDGVCTECGKSFVPKISITMSDSYGDGWESAAINIKKDGVSVALATLEFNESDDIFTMEYSPTSQYEFLWVSGGPFDMECSFVISLDDQILFTGEREGAWLNNTETPFYTIDAAEACWGASLERLTSWGTYSEAISAAEAGRATYVKLNKDVTSVTEIHSGTFTLDVNGHVMRVNDYVLNIQGANVTITDSSEGPVGILHNNNYWHRAIMASNGATVYIEKVQVMGAGAVEVLESSNVTIASGTYSSTEHPTVENKSGTLTILGGTFQTERAATVTSIKSAISTTISGGTFAEGYDATIIYETGVLDLSGWANPAGISVYTYDDVPLGASTISLPTDYLFFNGEEVATEVLSPGTKYTIRKAEIFTVAFDANGGTGEMEDVSTYSNYRLPECTFTAPEGLGFKAWMVNEVEYQPNDVITITGNTTITAVWATPYTLAFSANGGVGSLVALKTLSTVTLPECPFLAPEGKEFKAWRIGENEYAAGSVATLTEDAVAYAVWRDALAVHELDVVIIPMSEDAGEGATVRIMRDGIEIDRVEITVAGELAHRWIPYDSNSEYTFYWESRLGDSSWEVDVNIHLGPERIFREFGHYLEHEYRDRPFLTIPAKTSAGSTLETLNIIDGELPEYNVLREAEVGTLTYQRTLPNQEWNALFLPFEIPLSELEEDYEVAYFNDMHAYDRNTDGQIDELEMEIILLTEGTLHANHPYLIRAKSEAAKELNLSLTDATIYNTEERTTITCSSAYMNFELVGVYEQKTAAELDGCYAITTEGAWAPVAAGAVLNPFRLYLNMEARSGSPVKVNPAALSKIRIRMMGDNVATDIDAVGVEGAGKQVIYDLSGRRVENPGKGLYIVNGKKVMMK